MGKLETSEAVTFSFYTPKELYAYWEIWSKDSHNCSYRQFWMCRIIKKIPTASVWITWSLQKIKWKDRSREGRKDGSKPSHPVLFWISLYNLVLILHRLISVFSCKFMISSNKVSETADLINVYNCSLFCGINACIVHICPLYNGNWNISQANIKTLDYDWGVWMVLKTGI